nr:LINE-1 reverse transcriptase isogeny [Tanacetum cinerariifolium]
MCEMACQIIQKKQEEKRIEEEQAAKAQNSKIPVCYDDDDDYNSAITQNDPVNSLSMRDEHLNTFSATKSDEFIKSCVENLVPNPSESKGENGCDVPASFTTFSNILFDVEYEFDSSDDQSLSDEDFPEKIFSNPLFEEEIISTKIDPHYFDVESDLIESMLNHDSSIIPSSSKIDSFLDEFACELILLKSISPRIDEIDCYHENDIRLIDILLYDNSSPRPPKEFVFENSYAEIESFSPSPIPIEESDYRMEEIDLIFTPNDPMSPSIEDDDNDSERDILILEELPRNYSLSLPEIESFYFIFLRFLVLLQNHLMVFTTSGIRERVETRETSEPGSVCRLLRSRGRIGVVGSLTVRFLQNLNRRLKKHRSRISRRDLAYDLLREKYKLSKILVWVLGVLVLSFKGYKVLQEVSTSSVLLSSTILSTSLLLGLQVSGVKAINRVSSIKSKLKDTEKSNSPIKSKLKDTGKSNSPKSRWVPMSERIFSPQLVTQYKPITGGVRKKSEKSANDDNPKVSKVLDESNMSAVVAPVIDNVSANDDNPHL